MLGITTPFVITGRSVHKYISSTCQLFTVDGGPEVVFSGDTRVFPEDLATVLFLKTVACRARRRL